MAVHCTFMYQPPAALDCVHDLHPCVSIQSACLYLCVIGTRSPLAYSTTSLACLCECAQICCSLFLRYLSHGCRFGRRYSAHRMLFLIRWTSDWICWVLATIYSVGCRELNTGVTSCSRYSCASFALPTAGQLILFSLQLKYFYI